MLIGVAQFLRTENRNPANTFGGVELMGGCPEESGGRTGRTFQGNGMLIKSVDFVVDAAVPEPKSRVVSWNECVLPSWWRVR
jgi:hypothetical protein